MLGFRGLHWIYDVTEHNAATSARASAFRKLIQDSAHGDRQNTCAIKANTERQRGLQRRRSPVVHVSEERAASTAA
jgi:hypothetical protein